MPLCGIPTAVLSILAVFLLIPTGARSSPTPRHVVADRNDSALSWCGQKLVTANGQPWVSQTFARVQLRCLSAVGPAGAGLVVANNYSIPVSLSLNGVTLHTGLAPGESTALCGESPPSAALHWCLRALKGPDNELVVTPGPNGTAVEPRVHLLPSALFDLDSITTLSVAPSRDPVILSTVFPAYALALQGLLSNARYSIPLTRPLPFSNWTSVIRVADVLPGEQHRILHVQRFPPAAVAAAAASDGLPLDILPPANASFPFVSFRSFISSVGSSGGTTPEGHIVVSPSNALVLQGRLNRLVHPTYVLRLTKSLGGASSRRRVDDDVDLPAAPSEDSTAWAWSLPEAGSIPEWATNGSVWEILSLANSKGQAIALRTEERGPLTVVILHRDPPPTTTDNGSNPEAAKAASLTLMHAVVLGVGVVGIIVAAAVYRRRRKANRTAGISTRLLGDAPRSTGYRTTD